MQTILTLLPEVALKGTFVLAASTLFLLVARRISAARRYAIWFSAMMILLLLPALIGLLPQMAILPRATLLSPSVIEPAGTTSMVGPVAASGMETGENSDPRASQPVPSGTDFGRDVARGAGSGPSPAPMEPLAGGFDASVSPSLNPRADVDSPWNWLRIVLPWVWLAGALVAAAPILFGLMGVRRLARATTVFEPGRETAMLEECRHALDIPGSVILLRGPRGAMPMTWGTGLLAPVKLLVPAEAVEWSGERLRAVLLHELAHVRRRDCLTQLIGRCAAAIYWFHPWVWTAAARMRIERERACDDIVLRHSGSAATYAHDLVEVASRAGMRLPGSHTAIAMARPARLDTRLRAILDRSRNRRGLGRRMLVGLVLISLLVAFPVASLQWAAMTDESSEGNQSGRDQVELTVIDAATGLPVADANIQVQRSEEAVAYYTAVTNRAGVAIVKPPDEEFAFLFVLVKAQGFAPTRLIWPIDQSDVLPESYTVALEPGVSIGGRIVDENGDPVAGATVVIHVDMEESRVHERFALPPVESGADGGWEHPTIPRNSGQVRIGVHHPDYASHSPGSGYFPVRAYPQPEDLYAGRAEHVLSRGEFLDVRVLDERGSPAHGASVAIGRDRKASFALPEGRTDEAGRVRLAVHPEENVVLTVKHTGHAPEQVRVPGDARPPEVRVELEPGRPLRAQVVDTGNVPVAGARVFLDTWRDTRTLLEPLETDSEGWVEWNEAPADPLLVDVLASGYVAKRRVSIQPGRENRIVLAEAPVVRATVVDATTGRPVPQPAIEVAELLHERDRPSSWYNIPVRREEEGRFEVSIADFEPFYAVRVEADGYLSYESSGMATADGDVDLSIELQPSEGVSGRVIDAEGEPVPDVEVVGYPGTAIFFQNGELMDHARRRLLVTKTDADGIFEFRPEGKSFLMVAHHEKGYGELTSGETHGFGEVVLEPWGRLEGEVSSGNSPAAGHLVRARYSKSSDGEYPTVGYYLEAPTDSEGRFLFERVPPRKIVLARALPTDETVFHPNQALVRLAPGTTFRTHLGGRGRTVIGRVSLEPFEGRDWRASNLTLQRGIAPKVEMPEDFASRSIEDQNQWFRAWMDSEKGAAYRAAVVRWNTEHIRNNLVVEPDGSFRVDDLQPGTYTLKLSLVPAVSARINYSKSVTHEFTVPEIAASPEDTPLELPLLELDQ